LAAAQRYAGAQYNIGVLYDHGKGVPKDTVQAYMWYDLAASNGDEGGKKNRDLIAKEMTPEQIAEAKRLAKEEAAKP
jgi:TPR repeat protein